MDGADAEEHGGFLFFVLASSVVFIVLFFTRRYFKGGQFNERVSAKGLVAVVTGSNCGIGFETVRELNLRKADVYMLCRSEEKANEAKRMLVRQGCDATRLHFIECDLTDFESVRRAAKETLESTDTIDILINNAGIMFQSKHEQTKDGHEKTWQSNHLGPFLLTELFLPAVKKSSYARIINVSSRIHLKSEKINLATVDDKKSFGMMKSYRQSKLANVMHARALTKELRKDGAEHVTVNSLHPGVVNTELARNTILNTPGIKQITAVFRWFLMKTSRDGAQTSIFLALGKKIGGISGKYFADCKLTQENPLALDDQACQDLYNYSLECTGLASEGSGDQSQQRPWASPRQQPIKGIVQPRVLPPFGKPTRHTNKLDYIMTTVLKEAGKHKHVWPFQKPVDAVALCIPLYHERVARPMDLKTIENRLKSTYYTCAQECIDDIETVFQNCYTFNGKEDDVTIMAQNVHEVIKKSLEQAPREEHDMDVYWGKNKKKPAKSDGGSKSSSSKKNDARGPSEAPSEAGSEVSSVTTASAAAPTVSESASVAAKPERKVAGKKTGKRKAESEDDEKPEPLRAKREVAVVKKEVHQPLLPSMKPCLKLLNDFSTKKYQEFAWPFNEPVDAEQLGLHDYHKIIKEPMDLKSMKAKMESGAYKEPSDFEHDVRLMLRNCFLYNPVGDPVHSFGLRFQEVFDRRWAELGDSSSRASSVAPQSAPIAPTPKVAKSSAPKEPKESRKEHKKETTFEASGAKSEDLMQINNALSMIREREEKLKAELAAAQAIKDKLTSVKNRREDNPNEPFPEKLINETRALCTTQVGQNASSSSASSAALRNGRSKKAASARLYGYEFDSDDEDNKMALTYEEKRNLSNLINNLPNNQLNTIISIIQRRERSALMQQQLDDSEVELDFESLGDMCLREMGAFIKTIPTLNGNGDDEKPKTSSNPTSSGATGSKGSSSLESKNGKKKKNFNMSESSDDETSNSRKRRKRESSESQSSSSSDDDSDDEDRPSIPRKSGQPPSTSREWNQSSAPPPRMGGMGGQPPMSRVPASSSTSVSAIGKNNAAASSNSYQAPKPAPVPAPTSSRPPAAPRPPSKPKKTGGASILDTLLPDTFGASPPQSQPTTSATIRSPTESQPGNGEDEQTRIQRMRMEAKRARQKEDEGSVSLSNQMEMMAAFEFDNTY